MKKEQLRIVYVFIKNKKTIKINGLNFNKITILS